MQWKQRTQGMSMPMAGSVSAWNKRVNSQPAKDARSTDLGSWQRSAFARDARAHQLAQAQERRSVCGAFVPDLLDGELCELDRRWQQVL
jgi:hypothetical protein